MTSYFLFIKTERTKIQAENPSASVTDITKMCGQRWREMDATGKQEYEKQAADDKLRYAKELQEWQEAHPDEVAAMEAQAGQTKRGKKRAKKTAGGPKRATTAYFFYTNAIRPQVKEQHPDMKVTEMAKVMGSKWKELSADEKQKYVDMAAEDQARYQREKAAWELEQAEAKRARTADSGHSDAAIAAPTATAAPTAPMSAASAPAASQLCDVL